MVIRHRVRETDLPERVEIPRPRNLLEVRADPRFAALSRLLWRQLFEEVSRAYGRHPG